MKIVQVGPNSVHLKSHISGILSFQHELFTISEEALNIVADENEFLVDFRKLHPKIILQSYRKLKKILRQLNPDVVHIHQVNRLAYFTSKACSKLGIKCISTAWGSDVLLIPKQNKFYHFLVRKTLERSSYVTADSNDMITEMQAICPSKNKYKWVQYGINTVESQTKETIIYSNRLHESLYRINVIIDYFNEFQKQYPQYRLVIAGSGKLSADLKKQVEDLQLNSKVAFVGWLNAEENRAWYAKAAIYVSIPSSDGTSVSVLEAMSAECLIVLSDLPVSKEWITNGQTGIIEQAGKNPFIEVLNLDEEHARETNKKLILEKATKEKCASFFNQLYYDLK